MLSVVVFGFSLTAGFAYLTYQSYQLTVSTAVNGLMNLNDAKQQGVIRFLDQNEKLAKQLAHLVNQSKLKIIRSQFRAIVASDVFQLNEHPFKEEINSGKRSIPTWAVYRSIDYVVDDVIRISSDLEREGTNFGEKPDVSHGYSDPWYDGTAAV